MTHFLFSVHTDEKLETAMKEWSALKAIGQKLKGTEPHAIHVANMTVKLPIPAPLTEHGLHSNQTHMRRVNHRDTQLNVINCKHAKGRAIKDSFADPNTNGQEEESFGVQAPCFLVHNCVDTNGKEIDTIQECIHKEPERQMASTLMDTINVVQPTRRSLEQRRKIFDAFHIFLDSSAKPKHHQH